MKLPESALAHKYLDDLKGLEIGGSAHNPFGLDTLNIDITDLETPFKKLEKSKVGEFLKVDIVAPGDELPFPDESQDFIVSAHVLEHFPDPIKALKEWYRVVKKGGYIFMIVPHKKRTFDKNKERTTAKELFERYENKFKPKDVVSKHYSFWITEDLIELIRAIDLDWKIIEFQDKDDKLGNGFSVLIKKEKEDEENRKKIDLKLKENKKITLEKITSRIFELMKNSIDELKRNGINGLLKRIKEYIK